MKLVAGALVLAVLLLAQVVGAGVFLVLYPLVSTLAEEARIVAVALIGCLAIACAVLFVAWALRQIPRLINHFRRP